MQLITSYFSHEISVNLAIVTAVFKISLTSFKCHRKEEKVVYYGSESKFKERKIISIIFYVLPFCDSVVKNEMVFEMSLTSPPFFQFFSRLQKIPLF